MGVMTLKGGIFWSDATQDLIDAALERRYELTKELDQRIHDRAPGALDKAWEIFGKAKKDLRLKNAFMKEAKRLGFKAKVSDYLYGLKFGLMILRERKKKKTQAKKKIN